MQKNRIFNKILICGYGVIGKLLAQLLLDLGFKVVVIDVIKHEDPDICFETANCADIESLRKIIRKHDLESLVSCLPYNFNKALAGLCLAEKLHYFDPTEDVKTTNYVQEIAKKADSLFVPQNGLAPGIINIIANGLIKKFDTKTIRSARLRVGALPQNPVGDFGYACNWSPEGLVNEYIKPSIVVEDFTKKEVRSMGRKETIFVNGVEYEAFLTSGGVGTLCEAYDGEIRNLNYKSIRYPGHLDCLRIVIDQLKLRDDQDKIVGLFRHALLPDDNDHVIIHVSVEGEVNGRQITKEFVADYYPQKLCGKYRTAISWTTALSIATNIELSANGVFGSKGFVAQEQIPIKEFFTTKTGSYFIDFHNNKNIFEELLNE
ncbi:MAG: L-lysine dehydrogenase [Rickettsiales bacterium]|jgi:saccharopine dehydrogenase-like NADP-dependent oxidoreductase|nr:L-lysine dehydrogenase [Rickettsiales bacterium]